MNQQLIEQVAALAELQKQATPGPWYWDIRPKSFSLELVGRNTDTVLRPVRWGMGGASLMMPAPAPNSWILEPIHKDAVAHPGRQHHFDWARTAAPNRPNALFIPAACSFDFAALLTALTATPAPSPSSVTGGAATLLPAARLAEIREFHDDCVKSVTERGDKDYILAANYAPEYVQAVTDLLVTQAAHDGWCVSCAAPKAKLPGQYWGSCSNSECPAYQEDNASVSYIQPHEKLALAEARLAAALAPTPPLEGSQKGGDGE